MKRISKVTVIALTAFFLLGSLPVLAIDRPFALNGKGVATFTVNEAGIPVRGDVTSTSNATHLGLCTTVGSGQLRSRERSRTPGSSAVQWIGHNHCR